MKRAAQLLAIVGALLSLPAHGQEAEGLDWGGFAVITSAPKDQVHVDEVEGIQVLTVSRAAVDLAGVEFSEGVIEFDLAFEDRFGFGGIQWHVTADSAEYFYIRQHKSGEPDAGQYTPVRGGLTSWQLYTDRNGIIPLAFTHEGWNHFKMVVIGDKAEIYFNGSATPQLHIPDLATDRGRGGIGFRSSGPEGRLRLANLTVRPLAAEDRLISGPAQTSAPPAGVIGSWAISRPFPESAIAGAMELPEEIDRLGRTKYVRAEPSGIADLSRAVQPGDDHDTVAASTELFAAAAKRVLLRFGYSDRLRLYLNGDLVFEGNAGWRTRDHFFLGTVGFLDSVVLPLREGTNRLDAVVSETFGGWAIAGAIADRDGISISERSLE